MNERAIVEKVIKESFMEVFPEINYEEIKKNNSQILGNLIQSLGLVSLVVVIEEKISDNLNKDIVLVSDKAFSRNNSPFSTVALLIDYVTDLVME